MKYNQYAIESLKDKLIELSMKSSTPKKYAANMFEAYEVIKQLQNNQRWYNPKDKMPEPDCGGVGNRIRQAPSEYHAGGSLLHSRVRCAGWVDCERLSRMYISKNRSMDAATVLSGRMGGITMKTQEIIKALRRMAVNTGTLNCLGCGYEHSCSVHGCRVLREAADKLKELQAENDRLIRSMLNPSDDKSESGLLEE